MVCEHREYYTDKMYHRILYYCIDEQLLDQKNWKREIDILTHSTGYQLSYVYQFVLANRNFVLSKWNDKKLVASCFRVQYPHCSATDLIGLIHKSLHIKNSFVSIKMSPTNLAFELIIEKNPYSQMRLSCLI